MKTITITNLKGGVGKTTTAINLAHRLASEDKRVLLLDTDHQANLSRFFNAQSERNIYQLFIGKTIPQPYAISDNLHMETATINFRLIGQMAWHSVLRNKLVSSGFTALYDYCIIDCPPALDMIVTNALTAADYVLIPLTSGQFAYDGLRNIIDRIDEIKESGTINIGVFSDKNPFGYVDENGEYQGYDVYFANRLAEDLGVDVNFVSPEAASRIEYLQTGKADVILANFTVTPEREEEVDFALPYMNVSLGVISPDSAVVESLDDLTADDPVIVISGTTAETYLTENYPDLTLQKYDSYATAKNALENGSGAAWVNDNTEVIAYALQNTGYTVGIPSLGSNDTIAPAVSKGNTTLLDWINDEIKTLGEEQFFHADYEATLVDTYGSDYEESLVVEGGVTK